MVYLIIFYWAYTDKSAALRYVYMETAQFGPLLHRPLTNRPPKNSAPGQVGPQVKKNKM